MPDRAMDLLKQGAKLWYEWLKEAWKPLAVLVVTAVMVFAMSASNRATQRELERVATETHTALCTFKTGLQTRYNDTVDYLKRHPGPEPIPGITRADLRRSLEGQRHTLDALSGLDCTISQGGE